MKLRKTKIAFLLIDLVLLCGSIVLSFILDPLKSTREELDRFYRKEFEIFTIDKIISIPYPSGRGDYRLFCSSIHQEYFPILLEVSDDAPYELFKVETIIDKPAFSVDATLRNGEVTHHVKIRKPKDEISKGDYMLFTVFFGLLLPLFLILPNTFFENLLNIMFNEKE